MPYIKSTRVSVLNRRPLDTVDMLTPGELNYAITRLLMNYIELHGLAYTTINDVRGAVENAGSEFYRRIAVPYEQQKIRENGDVYAGIVPEYALGST